jgi:hypothetical protein
MFSGLCMNEQTAKLLQKVSERLRDAPDIFFRRRSVCTLINGAHSMATLLQSALAAECLILSSAGSHAREVWQEIIDRKSRHSIT